MFEEDFYFFMAGKSMSYKKKKKKVLGYDLFNCCSLLIEDLIVGETPHSSC